jgi:hypothetical protein
VATEASGGRPKDLPRIIGAYRVVGELGRGRLGAVVRAVQRSTGRTVALRVLRPEWACLPALVARLARDAFAATLVDHPNLVRLIELGEAQGRVHFASEFVDGTALADGGQDLGVLAAREAAAVVLQAARGLRFAHGQGLTHGDINPGCLFVDRLGLIKVADLGLAKTPAAVEAEKVRESTGPIALGAPAPKEGPSPEAVRADVRGLGWTLDHLVTGRPPGSDADAEPQALLARGLPMNLVETVRAMVDPRPGEGFADLNPAIAALERFVDGRKPGSATTPREEHTRILAECLGAFRTSPSARLRAQVVRWGLVAWGVLVVLSLLARLPRLGFTVFGLGVMTALARFVIGGVTRPDELFAKARALAFESRAVDWLVVAVGLALLISALVVLRLLGAWLVFGALAVALAVALHALVDRKAESERRGAVEEAEALIKALRLQGMSEDTIRRLVRGTAGDGWGEFYEALFGFEARRAAVGPEGRGWRGLLQIHRRYAPWRDPLADWLDAAVGTRRAERDRRLLQRLEERGMVAEGVNLVTARRRAWRAAEAMIVLAAEARAAARGAANAPPTLPGAVRVAAEVPEEVLVGRETGLVEREGWSWSWLPEALLGARTRFLLGAAVLAGCLLWVRQNEVIPGAQLRDVVAKVGGGSDPLEALRNARLDVRLPDQPRPLDASFLPRPVAGLFEGLNAGAAGLILVLSALVPGWRAGVFAVAGAAVALLGPKVGIPRLGPLDPRTVAMTLGAGIALAGAMIAGRRG